MQSSVTLQVFTPDSFHNLFVAKETPPPILQQAYPVDSTVTVKNLKIQHDVL